MNVSLHLNLCFQVTHPSVKQFQARFPYYEIVPDEKRGTVTFKVNDDVFTVEELVGLVLKHAAENAARFAGLSLCFSANAAN